MAMGLGNPHILDKTKSDIVKVKNFWEKHNLEHLTKRKWQADEVWGWEMTSISSYVMQAKWAYRIPWEQVQIFIIFKEIIDLRENKLNEKFRFLLLSVFLFFTILFILNSFYLNFNSINNKDYEYSHSSCEMSDYMTPRNYMNNIFWSWGNIVVKSDIEVNCGTKIDESNIMLKDNNISLYINGISDWSPAACDCVSHTTFTIKKPIPKDYEVILFLDNRNIDNISLKNGWNVINKKEE